MLRTANAANSLAEHVHHEPASANDAAPPAKPLTRRALAKQRTRRHLLDAAKRLFNERGYEAATVREIAAAAGLSTGAVFASFADKAELFGEVIMDDFDALIAQLKAADREDAATEAALLALFGVIHAFQRDHLPLVRAAIGHSWLGHPEAELRVQGGVGRVLPLLADVLRRGVERGELSSGLDLTLTADMLWEAFVSNYRRGHIDVRDAGVMMARLSAQIHILLAGWRAAA